jgi:hypothetical protein
MIKHIIKRNGSAMSINKKKPKGLIDLPAVRINEQLDQRIEGALTTANKNEKVTKVDFLRECIMRGLKSIEQGLAEKTLKVGYLKANTIDGVYFYGDFLKNNEEIISLDDFITALATLEERQEITTFIGAEQEEIYFKLVREYGISHYQYFTKQDGEKVEYAVFFKDSENVFLRCFAESGYIAQQQAMAIYLDKHTEEASRDIKELAKNFKVTDKFKMVGGKSKR